MHITTGKFVEVNIWEWMFKRNSNTPGLVVAYDLHHHKTIDLPGNKLDSEAFCDTYKRICNLQLEAQDIDGIRWSQSVEVTTTRYVLTRSSRESEIVTIKLNDEMITLRSDSKSADRWIKAYLRCVDELIEYRTIVSE